VAGLNQAKRLDGQLTAHAGLIDDELGSNFTVGLTIDTDRPLVCL